jgi:hypothetical protein
MNQYQHIDTNELEVSPWAGTGEDPPPRKPRFHVQAGWSVDAVSW